MHTEEETTPAPAAPPDSELVQELPEGYDEQRYRWDDAPRRPLWVNCLVAIVVTSVILCLLLSGVLLVPQFLDTERDATTQAALDAGATPDLAHPQTALSKDESASGASSVAPSSPATKSPASAGSTPGGPNLVVREVRIELPLGSACLQPGEELGTTLTVENTGDEEAGPFVVEVNSVQEAVDSGLAAGETVSVWFPGYAFGQDTVAVVDVGSLVDESDEEDNTFVQMVPIPTPPPACTPLAADELPSSPAAISLANTRGMAPMRITSRSVYSGGETNFMQFEVDQKGNARVAIGAVDSFEEWYVIDGSVYAGEQPVEGLVPYQPIENPESVAGFDDPFDLFVGQTAATQESGAITSYFPLHAVLAWGLNPDEAEDLGSEELPGGPAEKYRMLVEPEQVPGSVPIVEGSNFELARALEMDEENQYAYVWVEPDSGAIVRAEWELALEDGQSAQYSLEVRPVGVGPFTLPAAQEAGPTAEIAAAPTAETVATPAPETQESPGAAQTLSAEESLVAYWEYVNEGDFEEAWNLLSPRFQQRYYSGSYAAYEAYYKSMKLCSAEARRIRTVSESGQEAVVAARVVRRVGNKCATRRADYRFRMVYDAELGVWRIDEQMG